MTISVMKARVKSEFQDEISTVRVLSEVSCFFSSFFFETHHAVIERQTSLLDRGPLMDDGGSMHATYSRPIIAISPKREGANSAFHRLDLSLVASTLSPIVDEVPTKLPFSIGSFRVVSISSMFLDHRCMGRKIAYEIIPWRNKIS